MQLDEHIRTVHDSMAASAALGDERTRRIADTLIVAADAAVRLAILTALASVADEITAALLDSPGAPAITVQLDGDDVRVTVVPTVVDAPASPRGDDGDASARISLRLTESLKSDVENAAAHDGVSVNTWLVRAAAAGLRRPGHNPSRVSGWING